MAKELYWSGDDTKVYGYKRDFKDMGEFKREVKSQHDELCLVTNIKTEPCILTGKGIPADTCTPISEIDITIENMYTADVEAWEDAE